MKVFFIVLGFLSLGLGIVGIVVPGLPTTPFLLLALYCFSRGSERLSHWFRQTTIYQKYLAEYDRTRAMTLRQKVSILAISAPFCVFAFFVIPTVWGKGLLIAAVIGQYYYFCFKIKTLEKPTAKVE